MIQRTATLLLFLIPFFPAPAAWAEDNLADLIQQGNKAFVGKEFQKALDIYETGLQAAPKEPILFYDKGNVLYRQGQFAEAIQAFQEALNNRPPKLLLKDIYFNSGNSYFKLAEAKSAEEAKDIGPLKEALVEYEAAFDMYRKALELERQISIAEGRDLKRAGAAARQNWALARDGWTRTWEKIRESEKKNLKLEDGINNLLTAQTAMLPTLERIYLNSFSEDALKFNLRALAEYQLDYQEDLRHVQELAVKEQEKSSAEIDNFKASRKQANAGQVAPATGSEEQDPELSRLENESKNIEQIRSAVDQAAEMAAWIVDGLKRTNPLQAWKNSRQMIELLNELNSYLKKQDMIEGAYQSAQTAIADTSRLLEQANGLTFPAGKGSYVDIKGRMLTLAKAKSENAAENFRKINQNLEQLEEELEKENSKAKAAPPEEKDKAGKQDVPEKEGKVAAFFRKAAAEIKTASLTDLKDRHARIAAQLDELGQNLGKMENKYPLPDERRIEANEAHDRYQALKQALAETFALRIREAEEVQDLIDALLPKKAEERGQGAGFATALEGMEILLFKYDIFATTLAANTDEELEPLRQIMPANLKVLQDSWRDFSAARKGESKDNAFLTKLTDKAVGLRQILLQNLLTFAPDTGIALYYERLQTLQARLAAHLPATAANQADIKGAYRIMAPQLNNFTPLLQQYFSQLEEAGKNSQEIKGTPQHEAAGKSMARRHKAVDLLARSTEAGAEAAAALEKSTFLKSDFLFKDAGAILEKSHLAFMDRPDQAEEALKLGISQQESLREQSRAAKAIEAQEGEVKEIIAFLTANQTDVMHMAGLALEKIREQLANAEKEGANGPAAPGVPPGGAGPGGAPAQPDTSGLNEAISFVQEALTEAEKNKTFLTAAEFSNTEAKHERIIELLQKALDALHKKDDKSCDNPKNDEQKKDQEQQQEKQDPSQNQQQKGKSKPLELSPEEAKALLNELNKEDAKQQGEKVEARKEINVPRPW